MAWRLLGNCWHDSVRVMWLVFCWLIIFIFSLFFIIIIIIILLFFFKLLFIYYLFIYLFYLFFLLLLSFSLLVSLLLSLFFLFYNYFNKLDWGQSLKCYYLVCIISVRLLVTYLIMVIIECVVGYQLSQRALDIWVLTISGCARIVLLEL